MLETVFQSNQVDTSESYHIPFIKGKKENKLIKMLISIIVREIKKKTRVTGTYDVPVI